MNYELRSLFSAFDVVSSKKPGKNEAANCAPASVRRAVMASSNFSRCPTAVRLPRRAKHASPTRIGYFAADVGYGSQGDTPLN
jgi:hypothetical protein